MINLIETPKERKIENEIANLQEQLKVHRSNRTISCSCCNARTPLAKATVVSTYSYVRPHGCMGGDYHSFNEYLYYCPKCESFNRAYVGSWERDFKTEKIKLECLKEPRVQLFRFIDKFRHYFGERLELYSGDKAATIDELRKLNKERADR